MSFKYNAKFFLSSGRYAIMLYKNYSISAIQIVYSQLNYKNRAKLSAFI